MSENEQRLRRLERNQRLGMLLIGALAIVLAVAGAKSGESDTVRAQRVELVSVAGEVLAVLGVDDDGAAGLFIRDAEGRRRITLTHDPVQSALFIHDDEETVRIGVAQFAHGGGGLALHGPKSAGAAVLYYKKDGSLSFYDKEGQVTARVPPKQP